MDGRWTRAALLAVLALLACASPAAAWFGTAAPGFGTDGVALGDAQQGPASSYGPPIVTETAQGRQVVTAGIDGDGQVRVHGYDTTNAGGEAWQSTGLGTGVTTSPVSVAQITAANGVPYLAVAWLQDSSTIRLATLALEDTIYSPVEPARTTSVDTNGLGGSQPVLAGLVARGDGRRVLLGWSVFNGGGRSQWTVGQFAVDRFGSLTPDSAYGEQAGFTDGDLIPSVTGDRSLRAMAIEPVSGDLLLTGDGGFAGDPDGYPFQRATQVLALDPNGAPDTAWGPDGVLSRETGGEDVSGETIAVTDDGTAYVGVNDVVSGFQTKLFAIRSPQLTGGAPAADTDFGAGGTASPMDAAGVATMSLTVHGGGRRDVTLVYRGRTDNLWRVAVGGEEGSSTGDLDDRYAYYPSRECQYVGGAGADRTAGALLLAGFCDAGGAAGLKPAVVRLLEALPVTRLANPTMENGNMGAVRTIGLDRFRPLLAANPSVGTTLASASMSSAPYRGSPYRGSPYRGSPYRGSPYRGSPYRGSPYRGSPYRGSPLNSAPYRGSPLTDVPLLDGKSWTDVLDGTGLAGRPLQSVTLQQVYDEFAGRPSIGGLTLADLDTAASPVIRRSSAGAWLLLNRPLAVLPEPRGGWPQGFSTERDSLFSLELAGWDSSSYWQRPLALSTRVLGTGGSGNDAPSPLAEMAIDDVDLGATGLAARTISARVATLCEHDCRGRTYGEYQAAHAEDEPFGDWTVGDLVSALETGGEAVTLQDLLPGIVSRDRLPVDGAGFADLATELPFDPGATIGGLISAPEVLCKADGTSPVSFDVVMPGMQTDPDDVWVGVGDSRLGGELPDTTERMAGELRPGGVLHLERLADGRPLGALCAAGSTRLKRFLVQVKELSPPLVLGRATPKIILRDDDGVRYGEGDIIVGDDPDPSPEEPLAVEPGTAYTGFIAPGGFDGADVDGYQIPGGLPAGSTVTVSLGDLPEDFDLYVQGSRVKVPVPDTRNAARGTSIPTVLTDAIGAAGTDTATSAAATAQIPLEPAQLDGRPLRGSSTRNGKAGESVSFVVREGDSGGYLATVAGANGASSRRPYSLRVSIDQPGAAPACVDRAAEGTSMAGAFDWPTAAERRDARTLVLWNPQRIADASTPARARALGAKLQAYAAHATVGGVVVPVEEDPAHGAAVRAAYDAFDANPCDPGAANDVVAAIGSVVDDVAADGGVANGTAPDGAALRHIVMIGGDDQLPQARVPDQSAIANERTAAGSMTVAADGTVRDTPISAALRAGDVLSDDPYGEFDPRAWLGGQLAVPDVGLGRVVETPAQIERQLDAYLAADGVLRPAKRQTAGYDFMADLAETVATVLGASRTVGGWDASVAKALLSDTSPAITSVNAHHDAQRLLAGDETSVLAAEDTRPAVGSLLFTIGCHAALDAIAAYLPEPGADWAQRLTEDGSVFVGNTGYGLGDTAGLAYGERLLRDYATQVQSGSATVGQSLTFAKQRYLAETPVLSVYDAKTTAQLTTYGLPTYRVGAAGREALSVLPPDEVGGSEAPDSFSVTPAATARTDARGTWYQNGDEAPIAAPLRPLQPKLTQQLRTTGKAPAHGVLITGLTSRDVPDVDPVVSRPVVEGGEAEPPAADSAFPDVLGRVDRYADAGGRREAMTLATGQFLGGSRGTQRLFTRMDGQVLRGTTSDWEAPPITAAAGRVQDGVARFVVQVGTDGYQVERALLLVQTGAEWTPVELEHDGDGAWTGTLPVGDGPLPVFYAQVVDWYGNVGAATGKGAGIPVMRPANVPAPTLQVQGTPSATGYFDGSAQVLVDAHGRLVTVTVDGTPVTPDERGLVTVTGDGVRSVAVTDDETGRSTDVAVPVDDAGPRLTSAFAAGPGADGWFRGDATVRWTCSDLGSGVATCPAPSVVTGEGRDLGTGTVTATDRLGHERTASRGGIKIDATPPVSTATPPASPAGANGFVAPGAVLDLTATDALSGVAQTRWSTGGRTGTYAADPALSTGGTHVVRYSATDVAGNDETPREATVKVDATKPSLAGSVPAAGWRRSASVTWTCSDTQSGVKTCPATAVIPEGKAASVTRTATDRVGNVSASVTRRADVDRTAPTLSGLASPAPNAAGWNRGDVTVTWTCRDALSGVAGCPAASTVAGEGAAVRGAEVTATDTAGNPATATPGPFKIDRAAPSTVLTSAVSGGTRTVTLTATDATSGVAATTYAVDGQTTQTYTGPFTVPAGQHAITFGATDVAGNAEPRQRSTVGAPLPDTTPPGITSDFQPGRWYTAPVTIAFSCTDTGGSGVTACPAPVTVSDSQRGGEITSGTARDAAGNESRLAVGGIDIDRTLPVAIGTPTTAPNQHGWYRAPVTVRFACFDSFSGVRDGTCPAPVVVSKEGRMIPVAAPSRPVDVAGNVGGGGGLVWGIDRTAPGLTVKTPADGLTTSARSVTVSGRVTDGLSGVAKLTVAGVDAKRSGGRSQFTVALACGAQTIPVVATDAAGNTKHVTRRVTRRC